MPVSSLREVTLGVAALEVRIGQFQSGCGLSTVAAGDLAPMTAGRLFDNRGRLRGCVLGRPDLPDSPRIRLLEFGDLPLPRTGGLALPGPLGVGFMTREIGRVHSRLEGLGVRFLSPPLLLGPTEGGPSSGPPGPERFQSFGRTADGDVIELIERRETLTSDGTLGPDCSEPLHVALAITNLAACLHFMSDVLEHQTVHEENWSGTLVGRLLDLPPDVRCHVATSHRPGWPSGRAVFVEFEKKPEPMTQIPSIARGVCRLRYDTTDLHETLGRLPGGGGSLVRGPASIDDPVLGQGLVAMVRAPFGLLVELWQTEASS